jgi:LAO/AO transport system kinase
MEIPDLLVVTKADTGPPAQATLRDARSALGAAGARATPVLAVCALAPRRGIPELADALAEHRRTIDVATRRLRARRAGALAEYAGEHGERGLRRLGGRRSAEDWLSRQPAGLDGAALLARLEARAAGTG